MKPGASAAPAPRLRVAVPCAWGLLLLVASVLPRTPGLPGGVSDGVLHAAGYGLFAALVCWALLPGLGSPGAGLAGLAAGLTLGGLTELLQSFLPWRSAEFRDIVADGAGSTLLVGLVLAGSWLRARVVP